MRNGKKKFTWFSLEKMKNKGGNGAHLRLILFISSIRYYKGGILLIFTYGEKKTKKITPV
jgi:hypothetical protein